MADVPSHDEWLSEREAERLAGLAFPKRYTEARLARWTAKLALAGALRLDSGPPVLRELEVHNAPDGAPEVYLRSQPAPISISMTDRADWAVCTVIGGDRSIGCDLELVEPRSRAFVADYFTPMEQRTIAARAEDHDLLANLIWSAKESALKVLRTGLRRDTRSVEVTLLDAASGSAWSGLYVTTEEGLTFAGWWRRFGDFVLTYVSDASTAPPASLIEPAPLEDATPSHGWSTQLRRH